MQVSSNRGWNIGDIVMAPIHFAKKHPIITAVALGVFVAAASASTGDCAPLREGTSFVPYAGMKGLDQSHSICFNADFLFNFLKDKKYQFEGIHDLCKIVYHSGGMIYSSCEEALFNHTNPEYGCIQSLYKFSRYLQGYYVFW